MVESDGTLENGNEIENRLLFIKNINFFRISQLCSLKFGERIPEFKLANKSNASLVAIQIKLAFGSILEAKRKNIKF